MRRTPEWLPRLAGHSKKKNDQDAMSLRVLQSLILPVTVAGVVPWLLVVGDGVPEAWPPSPLNAVPAVVLLAAGLLLLAGTVRLFATEGLGTLAPWDAPRRLVIRGPYRYVRNPMILGAFLIILTEAEALASRTLFVWFLLVVLANLIYIPLSEEPGLERRFGEAYREYRRNVPRWIPRRTPWEQPVDKS
jgi:protein-S-isoprenylcysteine O-methyltransferase Ste14